MYSPCDLSSSSIVFFFLKHARAENIKGLKDYAHSRGAKLVKAVSMSDNKQMTIATARTEFINNVLDDAINGGYDGINFDYEGNNPTLRDGFTALVVEAASTFHEKLPGSQVSIDAPIYPDYEFCNYDYKAIAESHARGQGGG